MLAQPAHAGRLLPASATLTSQVGSKLCHQHLAVGPLLKKSSEPSLRRSSVYTGNSEKETAKGANYQQTLHAFRQSAGGNLPLTTVQCDGSGVWLRRVWATLYPGPRADTHAGVWYTSYDQMNP